MSSGGSAGDRATRLRAILLFSLAMVLFAFLDSSAKFASRYLPALEITWVRYVGHTVMATLILMPWRDWAAYRTRRPVLQVVRAFFLFGSTLCNFYALRTLRLDQTTTINFGAVFTVTALAGPILGEWVGWRRWMAIIVGFIGVIIAMRPGPAGFDPGILAAVGSMFCYTGYILLTRYLSATESVGSLLLISGLVPSLLLAPAALPGATLPPTPLVAVALVATGIFGAGGHWLLTYASRLAPTSTLAPFLYTQLIWMIIAGYVFFGQAPDGVTLLGAAIIIGSALYILYRQQVRGDR